MEQGGSGSAATGTGADIDAHIEGNVGECRAQGDAFKKQANWFATVGDSTRTAQGQVEYAWVGQSADRCHDYLGNLDNSLGTAMRSADSAGDAMHTFASDLDTAQQRMQQVLQVAQQGELDIDGTVVKWPNDAIPTDPRSTGPETALSCPVSTATPEQTGAYNQAMARYNKRQHAYQECFQTATTARGMERTAHENLVKNLQGASNGFQGLRTYGGQAMSTSLAFAGSVDGNTEKLALRALAQRGIANEVVYGMREGTIPANADTIGLREQELAKAERLESGAARWGKISATIPQWIRTMAAANLNNLPGINRLPFLKNSKLLNKVPVAGTLLSAALAEGNVQAGSDPGKEWTKFGLTTAGGVGVAGVAALIPGPGWAFAASVAGGEVVNLSADYVVDHWPEAQATMNELNWSSTPYQPIFRPR